MLKLILHDIDLIKSAAWALDIGSLSYSKNKPRQGSILLFEMFGMQIFKVEYA